MKLFKNFDKIYIRIHICTPMISACANANKCIRINNKINKSVVLLTPLLFLVSLEIFFFYPSF